MVPATGFRINLVGTVQIGGKNVSKEEIENACDRSASDQDIHNTVLTGSTQLIVKPPLEKIPLAP
jgi:hypothetical protein